MKILIAEDEQDFLSLLTEQLMGEGYQVYPAHDGAEALAIFEKERIDMCLLDVMMPHLDGISVMRKIREKSNVPVLFLTARGEEIDRILGLSLGADDYLVKPFSMAELKARINVWHRRMFINDNGKSTENILVCGKIRVDMLSASVSKGQKKLLLNAKEYKLLVFFMKNQNRLLTKKQLYHAVWGEEYFYDDNTVMVHINHLRNKIEDHPKEPEYLTTFRGIGYKLAPKTDLG